MQRSEPLIPEMIAKVQRCLSMLEEAQHLVNAAAQQLRPVPGFADEWSDLDEPYQVVKRNWYKIDGKLENFIRKAREASSGDRQDAPHGKSVRHG